MRTVRCLSVGLLTLALFVAADATTDATAKRAFGQGAPPPDLREPASRVGYAIGRNLGERLRSQGVAPADVNISAIFKGISDGFGGVVSPVTEKDLDAAMQSFDQAIYKRFLAKSKTDAEAFLAANKVKPGVKATASGLQYKSIKAGTGASPKGTDTVVVHYHGTLTDSRVFDSSVQREEPAQFPVNGVIPGWVEMLQLMKVGEKVEAVIPPNLAYGERGVPPSEGSPGIPPNAVLIFQIELLDIRKAP